MRVLIFAAILSTALGLSSINEKGVKISAIKTLMESGESDERIKQLLIEKGDVKSINIKVNNFLKSIFF